MFSSLYVIFRTAAWLSSVVYRYNDGGSVLLTLLILLVFCLATVEASRFFWLRIIGKKGSWKP